MSAPHDHHHNHRPSSFSATINATAASMATAPSIKFKSQQPLHNFSLPQLRWAHKNHHSTTAHKLPPDSPEPPQGTAKSPSSSRASRKTVPLGFSGGHQNDKSEKDDDVVGGDDGVREENNEVRPWNLRPRKVATLPPSTTFGVEKLVDSSKAAPSQKKNENDEGGSSSCGYLNKSTASRAGALGTSGHESGTGRQRKVVEEKRKLWISLSKEEIEEDLYSLTGSRPRKPKKRPRNIQKLLDNTFPALYLVGMSADTYRGHDTLR